MQQTSSSIFRIDEGQDIFQGIKQYATAMNLKSALFTGIGALSKVTLGFYHRDTQQHTTKLFPETYEIASLTGNISLADSEWFVHIHASLGGDDFALFGGHLIYAEASASTEIALIPLNAPVLRTKHPNLDIKVIPPFETSNKG